jgi:hypothetical protein
VKQERDPWALLWFVLIVAAVVALLLLGRR